MDSKQDKFSAMTRGELLAYCIANDRNGCWTDEACALESMVPATRDELLAIVRDWVVNNETVQL